MNEWNNQSTISAVKNLSAFLPSLPVHKKIYPRSKPSKVQSFITFKSGEIDPMTDSF